MLKVIIAVLVISAIVMFSHGNAASQMNGENAKDDSQPGNFFTKAVDSVIQFFKGGKSQGFNWQPYH
ncbi:unnamed protein product [Orchesella dallaii]|uniref:Uncharacterized protein n=1 Tax=Orchesella dallaii TaxID=48710 RepID=A0ABP1PV59_9HEXA